MTGSSQLRPGTSVRTIRKARMAPSGTAITVMPAPTMRVVEKAAQKSESANTKAYALRLSLAVGTKKGAVRKLW